MKSRLNLTIEESLLKSARNYAESHQTSISELVEGYFRTITTSAKRKTFVDLVNDLGNHNVDPKADLKALYYQDKKHGG